MSDQHTNRGEEGTISEEVLATLRQIIRAIDVHSKQLSKHFGLTGPQLVLIKEIGAHKDISVSELARKVSLSQATVTTIIDRLETRGLATRIRSARDKRKVTLRITPKAQEILQANPTFLQEEFIRNFERLEKWEQTQILSSIQRLAGMMKAEQFERHPVLSTQELTEGTTTTDNGP
jgi:DNA-binding MarR family transcriptional regulator